MSERRPDMQRVDSHIQRSRSLLEQAKRWAIENFPAGSEDLIRRTAWSYLRTAEEMAYADNSYTSAIPTPKRSPRE